MSTQDFDGLHMPLDGIRLIEASAGTGKTFSLAGLYLRLLVEKEQDVSQILVMTFTRAATRELRERIRLRINQAAAQALDASLHQPGDAESDFTEALLQACTRPRPQLARALSQAARRMDEAAIVTIHGYSQRAAADNAFNSSLPFDRGEAVDDRVLLREVAQDYWRQQALSSAESTAFRAYWPSADDLYKQLDEFAKRPNLIVAGPDQATVDRLSAQVRQQWPEQQAKLLNMLRTAQDDGVLLKPFSQKLPQPGNVEQAIEALDAAIAESPMPLPDWILSLRDASGFLYKKAQADGCKLLQELSVIPALIELQPWPRIQALRQARDITQQLTIQRKLQRRQYSFSDMITLLHQAMTGPQRGNLSAALHATWPWALVDEFQDTDPQQYEILQACYQNRETGGLIQIGDPKQAIYGFRGGDVHAYLDAAADAQQNRYGLRQNFRSTQSCLQAFEALFQQAGEQPFLLDGIGFEPVSAGRGEHSELLINGQKQAAMNIWQHAPPDSGDSINKGLAEPACRQACIAQIRNLLTPDKAAVIRRHSDEGAKEAAVQARDIAVLVNTNAQASAMQAHLSAAGIAAVCVHQQSVFESDQAAELLRVLLAAANPTDERLLRGALISELLAFPLSRLIQLEQDEHAWQQQVDFFQQAHESWRRHGVLALIQQLLQQASSHLLQRSDAQRCLSNYLQLAELLAEIERKNFGMSGVLQALQRAMQDSDERDQDAEQLRLESDAALVRVVTVHKSKGLEYPIVMLPFAPWLGTMGDPSKTPALYHADDDAVLNLYPDGPATQAAIKEHRAEGLRLLYVALTRTEICCYLPAGVFNGCQNGALASLLQRDLVNPQQWYNSRKAAPITQDNLTASLEQLQQSAQTAMAMLDWPHTQAAPPQAIDDNQAMLHARDDLPDARAPWRISSFSRLARHSHSDAPAVAGANDEIEELPIEATGDGDKLPQLPGGSRFGNAVHEVLETLDNSSWSQPTLLDSSRWRSRIEAAFARYGVSWDHDKISREEVLEHTQQLFIHTLTSPIIGLASLQAVPPEARRAEMEFHFKLGDVRYAQLLDTLQAHGYAQQLSTADVQTSLRGLMQGFIDLIVEQDQRFYVLDYKTNWLGDQREAYGADQLHLAIAQHHYDLQYLIYLVALHRYLAQRVPDYQAKRHLGGVRYLFVRGMSAEHPGDGIYQDQVDPQLIVQLDQLLLGEPA